MHHEPDTPGYSVDRERRYLDWFGRHLRADIAASR
jgi:hypothetical protein